MDRRDLLLKEMNIPQWELTKPQVLKGLAQIRLSSQIKFVVVSEEDHQQSRLFQDILCALALSPHEYHWCNAEQTKRLTSDNPPPFLMVAPLEKAGKILANFPQTPSSLTLAHWQDLHDPQQKRQFWQQLQPFSQPDNQ